MADWQTAQVNLGQPVLNAGKPSIRPIPASHRAYIQQLLQSAGVVQDPSLQSVACEQVEIEPLLAYQFYVDTDRSTQHCANLSRPPTLDELLNLCLPLAAPAESITGVGQPTSAVLKSPSLNVRVMAGGILAQGIAGVRFGVASPLVHVTVYNGRYYLHNGFHRAFGAQQAGATHIPAIIRNVNDALSAGIQSDGSTFSEQLLTSANPPTMAHFTQSNALAVQIRRFSRMIHLSWAEYAIPEE